MPRDYGTNKETLDDAVQKALAFNAKSGVMYLFRERMIRECIEIAIPIIVKPLMERIDELEAQLEETGPVAPTSQSAPEAPDDPTDSSTLPTPAPRPPKAPDARLVRLREDLEKMAELADGSN